MFPSSLKFNPKAMSLGALVAVISLMAVVGGGRAVAQSTSPIGQHVVQNGETFYCIGRVYGVIPGAIAGANGLGLSALLTPGQVLNIPAEQWLNIPSGPVCAAQFVSPFPGLSAKPPVASTPAPTTAAILGEHIIQRGETLFCIGRAYGVLPSAIGQANKLVRPFRLSPGKALDIPAVRWLVIPRGPVCKAQFLSPFTTEPTLTATNIFSNPVNLPSDTPTSTPTEPRVPSKTPNPTRTPPPTKTPSPIP